MVKYIYLLLILFMLINQSITGVQTDQLKIDVNGEVLSIEWNNSRTKFAVGYHVSYVDIFNSDGSRLKRMITLGAATNVRTLAWNKNDTLLAIGTDLVVDIFNMTNYTNFKRYDLNSSIIELKFHPEDNYLLVSTEAIELYSISTIDWTLKTTNLNNYIENNLIFKSKILDMEFIDSSTLVMVVYKELRFVNTSNSEIINRISMDKIINRIDYSSSRLIVSTDNMAFVYDVSANDNPMILKSISKSGINDVAINNDEFTVALNNGEVKLFNLNDKSTRTIKDQFSPVRVINWDVESELIFGSISGIYIYDPVGIKTDQKQIDYTLFKYVLGTIFSILLILILIKIYNKYGQIRISRTLKQTGFNNIKELKIANNRGVGNQQQLDRLNQSGFNNERDRLLAMELGFYTIKDQDNARQLGAETQKEVDLIHKYNLKNKKELILYLRRIEEEK